VVIVNPELSGGAQVGLLARLALMIVYWAGAALNVPLAMRATSES